MMCFSYECSGTDDLIPSHNDTNVCHQIRILRRHDRACINGCIELVLLSADALFIDRMRARY
jgi:hypothetical protein